MASSSSSALASGDAIEKPSFLSFLKKTKQQQKEEQQKQKAAKTDSKKKRAAKSSDDEISSCEYGLIDCLVLFPPPIFSPSSLLSPSSKRDE